MVNAVKEVADFAGDVIRPVADAAADVLRPVGEAILRSDEVKTVVNVAAVATGNSWAVPIINGADAIDEGADPEDVLKTIVISTVAAGAADAVGEVAAEALTDKVGSTVANFVADTGVNVVTNGGDIGAAVFDAGLKGSKIVSNTTNTIVDSLGIDTSTDLGKSLDKSLKTGISAEIMGEDGVKAASISAISDTIINPVLEKGDELTPEALGDVSKLVSTALVAGAKGENVYDAINQELGNTATADLRDLVKTKVKDFIDPVEELPMDTGEFLTEAVLPSKETLDKFRDTSVTEKDLPYSPQNLLSPGVLSDEMREELLRNTGIELGKSSDIARLIAEYEKRVAPTGSLSEQEILDDPKRFKGPTGAGIGPEVTDEDYQSQLAGILGEETPKVSQVSKRIIDDAKKNLAGVGYSVSSGTLEAIALQVEGTANIGDATVNKFRELFDKDPTRFLRDKTGKVVAWLDGASKDQKEKISGDLLRRRRDALPAEGMEFTTALPGGEKALDMKGRPYGTDKFATFLNASEEFGDVFTDMAVLYLTGPVLGPAITLSLGVAEGQADSSRRLDQEIQKAIDDGTLAENVGWQTMLADAKGDTFEEKSKNAKEALKKQFFKYTVAAGGLEAVGDLVTAKAALGTLNIKTIGDLYTKLTPKQRKAIGIPVNITAATGVGGLTEAGQTAITEKALRDFDIYPKTEAGASFLLGAAGQGGAVTVANTLDGINNALKSKYEKGTLSLQDRNYVENEILAPEGEFVGTPTAPVSVTEPTQVDTISKDISPADKEAWIRTIIGEAAGESDAGQAAVAHTILNRYKDGGFGKSLQDVVYADKQFSTFNPLDQGGNLLHKKSKSSPEYKRAEKLVNDILNGKIKDPTEGATHYWNPDVANPSWGDTILSQHKSGGKMIDSHIFGGNTGAVDTVDVAEVADNIDKKPTTPTKKFTTPTVTTDTLGTGQIDAKPTHDIAAEVVADILNKPTNFVTDADIAAVTDVANLVDTATDTATDTAIDTAIDTATDTATDVTPFNLPISPTQGIAQLAGLQQVRVDPPETADIEYFYDFEDIFANPEQRRMLRTPYEDSINRSIDEDMEELLEPSPVNRTGGDSTDNLLKLLRNIG